MDRIDFGAIVKELPFLLLLALSALANKPVSRNLPSVRCLDTAALQTGHLVFPIIYREIRLPVIAVLVFSLSVVDGVVARAKLTATIGHSGVKRL